MIFALYLNYFVRVFFFFKLKRIFRVPSFVHQFSFSNQFIVQFSRIFLRNPKTQLRSFRGPLIISPNLLIARFGGPEVFPFGIEHQTLQFKVLFLFFTPLSAECLAIISNTFTFVNTFLKVFLNFFQICAFFVKNIPFSSFFIHFD